MNDFGRKDFGSALRRLLGETEAAKPTKQQLRDDPEASEIEDFAASSKAATLGDKELGEMESGIADLLNSFEQKWNEVKDTLRTGVRGVLDDLTTYAAQNPGLTKSAGPTSREDAEREALGSTKAQWDDKMSRVAAAGDRERRLSTGATPKIQTLSGKDIDQGVEPGLDPTPGAQDDFSASQIQGLRAKRRGATVGKAAQRAAQRAAQSQPPAGGK